MLINIETEMKDLRCSFDWLFSTYCQEDNLDFWITFCSYGIMATENLVATPRGYKEINRQQQGVVCVK